ncbi:Probable lipoprotein precursor [Tenacibaculum maritimum]|nr:Probable lipoprotein precursor [Tenacibaculum maritimum]
MALNIKIFKMLNNKQILSLFLLILFAFSSCYKQIKKKNNINNSSDKEVVIQEKKQNGANAKDILSQRIKNYLTTVFLDESDLKIMPVEDRKFQYTSIDLNNDGIDEIFVYLNSRSFCGSGGCTFLLLDTNLNLITEFTVTRPPLLVSDTMENNWKKLYLLSDGYREIVYNIQNKSYPANPSVEKEVKDFNTKNLTTLFSSEKTFSY